MEKWFVSDIRQFSTENNNISDINPFNCLILQHNFSFMVVCKPLLLPWMGWNLTEWWHGMITLSHQKRYTKWYLSLSSAQSILFSGFAVLSIIANVQLDSSSSYPWISIAWFDFSFLFQAFFCHLLISEQCSYIYSLGWDAMVLYVAYNLQQAWIMPNNNFIMKIWLFCNSLQAETPHYLPLSYVLLTI